MVILPDTPARPVAAARQRSADPMALQLPELAGSMGLGVFSHRPGAPPCPRNVCARDMIAADGGLVALLAMRRTPDDMAAARLECWTEMTTPRARYCVREWGAERRRTASAAGNLAGIPAWLLVMHRCWLPTSAATVDSHDEGEPGEPITEREREVWQVIAAGGSAATIAGALGISVHTARRHTERLFRKLHVSTRAAAAREYYVRRLVLPAGRGSP